MMNTNHYRTLESLIAITMAFFLMTAASAAHAGTPEPGTVAIFGIPQNDVQLNAITDRAVQAVTDTFNRCGRFLPAERNRLSWALEKAAATRAENEDLYRKAGALLNAELLVTVITGRSGTVFVGSARIVPAGETSAVTQRELTVASRVMLNIPVKLCQEIARVHRDLKITAPVLERRGVRHLLGAGQWHGLTPGAHRTDRGEIIRIITVSRYQSVAELPPSLADLKIITIAQTPRLGPLMTEFQQSVEENAYARYGLKNSLLKNQDAEKKFIEALCLVNPATNLLLPGYGTHLSMSHLGFKDTSSSLPGVLLTTGLVITHLTLPQIVGRFKINYFPWVMDSNKTLAMQNLQIFMFATIPLTISAGFMDQLAHQCAATEHVPPFFLNRNIAAFSLSVMIPGGGLFYKGYRLFGWGFYFSEMFLGAFALYNKDKRRILLPTGIALGAIKLIELAAAFLVKPNYGFYHFETARQAGQFSLSLDLRPNETGSPSYGLAATMIF